MDNIKLFVAILTTLINLILIVCAVVILDDAICSGDTLYIVLDLFLALAFLSSTVFTFSWVLGVTKKIDINRKSNLYVSQFKVYIKTPFDED